MMMKRWLLAVVMMALALASPAWALSGEGVGSGTSGGSACGGLPGYSYNKSYTGTFHIPTQTLTAGQVLPYSAVVAQTDVMTNKKALFVNQLSARLLDFNNSFQIQAIGGNVRLTVDSTRLDNIAFCNIQQPGERTLFIIGQGQDCYAYPPIVFAHDFTSVSNIFVNVLDVEVNLVFQNTDQISTHAADAEVMWQIDECIKP